MTTDIFDDISPGEMARVVKLAEYIGAEKPEPNHIYSREWLYGQLGLEELSGAGTAMEILAEGRRITLRYAMLMRQVRDLCLENHRIYIESITGRGFVVVAPKEQAGGQLIKATLKASRLVQDCLYVALHVDTSKLSKAEARQTSDSLSRIAEMSSYINSRREYVGFRPYLGKVKQRVEAKEQEEVREELIEEIEGQG